MWPNVNANAGWQRQRLSEGTPTGKLFSSIGNIPGPAVTGLSVPNPYDQYQLGFDASWEIDLFGRIRRGVEAAGANLAASQEDSRAMRLSLYGEVARAYVDLRGAQAKRAVTVAVLGTQRDLLTLAGQRRGAGPGQRHRRVARGGPGDRGGGAASPAGPPDRRRHQRAQPADRPRAGVP